MTPRPPWLDEQPEILALLHRLLDRLDRTPMAERKQAPALTLDPGQCPDLFRLDPAADREWSLLQSLERSHQLVRIRRSRRRGAFDPEFAGARLQLDPAAEALLRSWLHRPRVEPYPEQWRAALAECAHRFPGDALQLLARPIQLPGQPAAELLTAFAAIGDRAGDRLSLRQLSARCFWGQSKFLDQREDLVRRLFPGLRLQPRPVLVNLHLPAEPQGLLFIENQDSYTRALAGRPAEAQGLILVYSAGFRGSARRIRTRDGARLHYLGTSDDAARSAFEGWWFGAGDAAWPLWFWGDLDYAGMGILKSLRRRFPGLGAWEPGYGPLLARLNAGGGHPPEADRKAGQSDPGETGCAYADARLLPALRARAACVDQEAFA